MLERIPTLNYLLQSGFSSRTPLGRPATHRTGAQDRSAWRAPCSCDARRMRPPSSRLLLRRNAQRSPPQAGCMTTRAQCPEAALAARSIGLDLSTGPAPQQRGPQAAAPLPALRAPRRQQCSEASPPSPPPCSSDGGRRRPPHWPRPGPTPHRLCSSMPSRRRTAPSRR